MQHCSYLFISSYIIFFQHFAEAHPCIKGLNGVGQIFCSLGCRRICLHFVDHDKIRPIFFTYYMLLRYMCGPVIKQISTTKVVFFAIIIVLFLRRGVHIDEKYLYSLLFFIQERQVRGKCETAWGSQIGSFSKSQPITFVQITCTLFF